MLSSSLTNKHRAQYEERLRTLIKNLEERNSIVFVHDLTVLVAAGSEESSLVVANILRSALMRAEIQCIWEATPVGYETTIQRIPWFVRCSRPINVLPFSEAETIQVLHAVKERYEKYHEVSYTEDALILAAQHSNGYLLKATDVLDAAGARIKLRQISAT